MATEETESEPQQLPVAIDSPEAYPIPQASNKPTSLRKAVNALLEPPSLVPIGSSIWVAETSVFRVNSTCWNAGGPGWYQTRKENGGYRIWKIKQPTPR